jgi:hypothetical protein
LEVGERNCDSRRSSFLVGRLEPPINAMGGSGEAMDVYEEQSAPAHAPAGIQTLDARADFS